MLEHGYEHIGRLAAINYQGAYAHCQLNVKESDVGLRIKNKIVSGS